MIRVAACAVVLAACQPQSTKEAPVAPSSAPIASVAAVASSATPAVAPTAGCHVEPAAGVVVPMAAKSQEFRLAAAGDRALVTWLDAQNPMGGGRRARGHLIDTAKGALDGAELALDESEYGDVIPSGIVPLGGTELSTAGCVNSAPSGILYCYHQPPGAKHVQTTELNFVNGGPQVPGVAALSTGADTLTFLPVFAAGQVTVVSSRLAPKRSRSFGSGSGSDAASADALSAIFTDDGSTEAMVVYRGSGFVRARRVDWDEKWKGAVLAVSEKGTLVGAPAITRAGAAIAVVFAARKNAKEPWNLTRAWIRGDAVERGALDVGEATGPTFGARKGDCVRFSWVEGHGKESVTKLGSLCGNDTKPQHVITLSQTGVEAGRAYLAEGDHGEVVAWQEFPAGKPELRVAKLVCN